MFSFTQPLLLFGLIGLVLPIVAHIIHHKTTKKIRFPSIRFITTTQIPQMRRRSLSDILLLLLRMLLLTSILFAISGPVRISDLLEKNIISEETIILMDQSASMAGWNSRENSFEYTRSILNTIEGAVGLVSFASRVHTIVPLQNDMENIFDAIKEFKQTSEVGHPQEAIEKAITLFTPHATTKKIIIISDFQTSNWQDVSVNLRQHKISLVLKDTRSESEANLAITNVTSIPVGEDEIRVSVYLNNYSKTEHERTLLLRIGGKEWQQKINLKPFQMGQALFQIPGGEVNASIQIPEPDVYLPDNEYFFTIQPPPPIETRIIVPQLSDPETQQELYFIKAALLSSNNNEWHSFRVKNLTYVEFDKETISDVPVLFFPGLTRNLDRDIIKILKSFIEKGGSVFITPGGPIAESLNAFKKEGLLNAKYKGLKRNQNIQEPFRISWVNPESSISRVFSGDAKRDLILTQIYKYISLEFSEKISTLIKIENDDPLIVRQKIGKGALIFISLRLNTTWSDLPLRNSFLPLLKELVWEQAQRPEWPNLVIGESFKKGGEIFTAEKSGLFPFDSSWIGVNVSRNESIPNSVSPALLMESLGSEGQQDFEYTHDDINKQDNSEEPLGTLFILLALLFFVIECIISKTKNSKLKAQS